MQLIQINGLWWNLNSLLIYLLLNLYIKCISIFIHRCLFFYFTIIISTTKQMYELDKRNLGEIDVSSMNIWHNIILWIYILDLSILNLKCFLCDLVLHNRRKVELIESPYLRSFCLEMQSTLKLKLILRFLLASDIKYYKY